MEFIVLFTCSGLFAQLPYNCLRVYGTHNLADKSLPIYFPSGSSSPLFFSLLPSFVCCGSGVFFPPPLPFPGDFALSLPPGAPPAFSAALARAFSFSAAA